MEIQVLSVIILILLIWLITVITKFNSLSDTYKNLEHRMQRLEYEIEFTKDNTEKIMKHFKIDEVNHND